MSRSLPQYRDDLAGFAGILRNYLGLSQRKIAAQFHLNHSTIARYEGESIHLPIGYLACLVRLALQKHQGTKKQHSDTDQQFLLREINRAIKYHYLDEPSIDSWDELCTVADEYLARLQSRDDTTDDVSPNIEYQNISAPASLTIPPAEVPLLTHFYVERSTLQSILLDKITHERVHTLVLWGAGGTGKSSLVTWLAQSTRSNYPGGQIYLELSENLESEEVITIAQTQLARRFGVVLSGTSLAERAGQLRTLLSDKQCLVILDNVWTTSGLMHLQVVNDRSCLLITTRFSKVPDLLEVPFVQVNGMTIDEGLALLTKWAGYPVTSTDLVQRLGGLPLALKLSGVQLRDGGTPAELLTYFQQKNINLSQLDLDTSQDAAESLQPCFDRSFNLLVPQEQMQFAQLGCFAGRFEVADAAKLWRIDPNEAQPRLRRLESLALVERKDRRYQLHPLLRDYARQKLATSTVSELTYGRHAAYYLHSYLYHPQVLDEIKDEVPNLDESWHDIVAGVRWAAEHTPRLATIAALLAHTERPALLETIGSPLPAALETYLAEITGNETEEAFLHELLGDLWLLSDDLKTALSHFDQALSLWQTIGDYLAGSRASLRLAGIHLLCQDKHATIEALDQAQVLLAQSLPITETNLEPARWLFYWFDLIYSVCVKWDDLNLLEKSVIEFVDLAQKTEQPLLEARGWHIDRLYAEGSTSQETRQKGRQSAAKAACLWWRHGQQSKALAEIMWTQEQTKGRRSRRMAEHFARRLSQNTPKLSQEQINLIENQRIRWWLEANEKERVEWLIKELPPPEDDDWKALEDILSISTMGERIRRIARGLPRPNEHFVSEPIWKILTGQHALPLSGEAAVKLIQHYLSILETELD